MPARPDLDPELRALLAGDSRYSDEVPLGGKATF